MKEITNQALNNVTIVGKVINTTFREGKTSEGKPYESVQLLVSLQRMIFLQQHHFLKCLRYMPYLCMLN